MSPTDIRILASELADSDIDNYDDEHIINNTSYSDEYEELLEKISDQENLIEEKEELLLTVEDSDSVEYEILEEEIDILKDEIETMENRKDEIVDDAREEFLGGLSDNHQRRLENDPVDYLVNDLGLYNSFKDLYETSNLVYFDRRQFCEDLADEGHYGEISSYDGGHCTEYINGEDYICIRTN